MAHDAKMLTGVMDATDDVIVTGPSIYVYAAPVRLWQWGDALCITILAVTGYFIGSPGMNVLPANIEGTTAVVGGLGVPLAGAPKVDGAQRIEIGIRPEFVRLERGGMPIRIDKVEDIGRQKIVRAEFAGRPIAIVLPEDGEIPADPRVTFDPAAINIYADSWRVGREG